MLSRWSRSVQANRSRMPSRRRWNRFRPLCEVLEDRRVLAPLVVTNTNDAGPGSLRAAILAANGTPGVADVITFDATLAGSTIALATDLDAITDDLEIDGDNGSGTPLLHIDGNGHRIFTVDGGNGVNIHGLAITGSKDNAITLNHGVSTIAHNWIGLDLDENALGNSGDGIHVHTADNTIENNIIVASGIYGIRIEPHIVTNPSGNKIYTNIIGTDATDRASIGNGTGIYVVDSSDTEIIGNIISGNDVDGVELTGAGTMHTVVQGNFIGSNAAGTAALANGRDGVAIRDSATHNLIGGIGLIPATPGFDDFGNLISGNGRYGILVLNSTVDVDDRPNNVIQGNYIGTDVTGQLRLPPAAIGQPFGNGSDGVWIYNSSYNVVGHVSGFGQGGNLISGNTESGVVVDVGLSGSSQGNDVLGNYIGVAADGFTPLGNRQHGVELLDVFETVVAFNVIADHQYATDSDGPVPGVGVYIVGGFDNEVRTNLIGTDAAGVLPLGNNIGVYGLFASDITIGGPDPADGNIIVASIALDPLLKIGGAGVELVDAYFNIIQANFIGLSPNTTDDLGNDGDGVRIIDSSYNLIGDPFAQAGNTIAHNDGNGVSVLVLGGESFAEGNAILANSIFSNGGLGIDLGDDGITPNDPVTPPGPYDGDFGPNSFQNFPILTMVKRTGTGVDIVGFLDSVAGEEYHIEFFANSIGDPEGRIFLGSLLVNGLDDLDGDGRFNFTTSLTPLNSLPPVPLEFTATATLVEFNLPGGPAIGDGFQAAPEDYDYIETSEFSPAELEQVADLAVVKFANASFVNPGDVLKFTISVGNNGPFAVDDVTLFDLLPSNVTFDSAFASQGSYDALTGIWDIGTLLDDQREALVIFVTVNPNPGTQIFNKACIETASLPDPFPDNNCDSVTVPVRRPRITDLAVSIVGVPQPVEVGNVLTYVVSAVNNGPLDSPATLVLALDAGTAFVGINVPAGWALIGTPPANTFGGNVVLQTANLPAGNAASVFVMDVFVNPTLPNNAVLLAKAAISTPLPESTLVNNFAVAVNTVIDDTDGTGIPPGSIGQVLIDDPAPLIELVDNRADFGSPPVQPFGLAEVRLGLTNNVSFFDLNIPTANTSGIINGIVFEDANGNGSRDLNEVVLDGMVFYLTRLRADDFDESRPVATTGRDGDFRFEGLAPGVYVVRPVPNRFYAVSAPQEGFYQVVVGAERSASVTFGVRPLGGRRRPLVPSGAVPLPARGMLALDELLPADSCLAVPREGVAAEVDLRDAVFCGADLEAPLAAEDDSSGIDWLAPVALASLLATTLVRPPERERRLVL